MQEEARLKIEPEVMSEIVNNQQASIHILKKCFEDNFENIQGLLFHYHYEKRERVYDLSVNDDSILFDGNKGSFQILYMIGFFNACADLDYNAPEKMKINFSVNKDKSEIHLVGEYWPERGQDEI